MESLHSGMDSRQRSVRPHFKPRLQGLLTTLGLDVAYERGAGDHLYFRDAAGREIEVLDLVGGYGSLILGHAHPALVAEAQRLLASGRPMHAQGSRREYAGRLAEVLNRRIGGDYCVLFGNSGTEAIEAAMKHAMLETGGRTFLTLERGFHGKTLGALQLTANPDYRADFDLAGLRVRRLPLNDLVQLERAFAETKDLAAFVFEPILGEGGVREVSAEFAARAAQLCAEHNVPLIADECQTGLGRTGKFLASEGLGLRPDYVVLSKSLGGGLAKISALLIQRQRYREDFELKHTSTFADDDYSCALALKTLDLVDDAFAQRCHLQGERLLTGLRALAAQYPGVIAEVRGRGLMIGLEFQRRDQSPSFLGRFLSSQDDLALVVTGYLLNVHRIRIAPTLSDRWTLRLEPSVLLAESDRARFLAAMADVCARLANEDVLGLTRFLIGEHPAPSTDVEDLRTDGRFMAYDAPRFHARLARVPAKRVAWLCHLVDNDDLVSLEPSMGALSSAEREQFLGRLIPRVAPVVLSSVDIHSVTGEVVRLYPILLPFTSRWAKRQMEERSLAAPQALVQQGIERAHSLGCQLLSLGQYTSIVTLSGTRVAAGALGVTTGNSYAVALAIQAIEQAHRKTGRAASESTLVVVGAGGNIGRICAELLAPSYRRILLVGSTKPGSAQRLAGLARQIPRAQIATQLAAVGEGHVVIAALNAVDAPLKSEVLRPDAIVCDLSVPASLTPEVARARPDLLLIKGGLVSLPCGEDLEIIGFPLPRGQTYGCMAEALLLGLEGDCKVRLTGTITASQVTRMAALAARHGFRLADYKRTSVLDCHPQRDLHAVA